MKIFRLSLEDRLLQAIKKDSLEDAESLLAVGANVNYKKGGNTPLLFALIKNNVKMVALLLSWGASLNDSTDWTYGANVNAPLCIAIEHNNIDMVRLLSNKGANVNYFYKGMTPLLHAVIQDNLPMVKCLIKCKANPNISCFDDRLALIEAVKKQNILMIKALLKRANPNLFTSEGSALSLAISMENQEIVKLLLEKVDVNDSIHGVAPILFAVRQQHNELIRVLVDAQADVNQESDATTPLIYAINRNDTERVQLLLQLRADPKKGKYFPLAVAVKNTTILSLLIESGANVPEELNKTLLLAISEKQVQAVKILVQAGANPNFKCRGYTPLTLAIIKKNLEIIKFLLDNKAQVNEEDPNYEVPIMLATQLNNSYTCILLSEYNANPSIYHRDTTPLIEAIKQENLQIVEELLFMRADVNQNNSECTPLSLAVQKDQNDLVFELLKNGANANLSGNKDLLTQERQFALLSDNSDSDSFFNWEFSYETEEVSNVEVTIAPPLFEAIGNNNKALVSALIQANVDVNLPYQGISPLNYAIQKDSSLKIIQSLVTKRADVNKPSEEITPLMSAVIRNNIKLVHFLLQNGSNPNSYSKGDLPLIKTIENDDIRTASLLIKHGASPKLEDEKGRSALSCINSNKYSDHAQYQEFFFLINKTPSLLEEASSFLNRRDAAFINGSKKDKKESFHATLEVLNKTIYFLEQNSNKLFFSEKKELGNTLNNLANLFTILDTKKECQEAASGTRKLAALLGSERASSILKNFRTDSKSKKPLNSISLASSPSSIFAAPAPKRGELKLKRTQSAPLSVRSFR
jgi:ankyrin repeat protein